MKITDCNTFNGIKNNEFVELGKRIRACPNYSHLEIASAYYDGCINPDIVLSVLFYQKSNIYPKVSSMVFVAIDSKNADDEYKAIKKEHDILVDVVKLIRYDDVIAIGGSDRYERCQELKKNILNMLSGLGLKTNNDSMASVMDDYPAFIKSWNNFLTRNGNRI